MVRSIKIAQLSSYFSYYIIQTIEALGLGRLGIFWGDLGKLCGYSGETWGNLGRPWEDPMQTWGTPGRYVNNEEC